MKSTNSSGNIFNDLGLPKPQDLLTKAKIASVVYDIIEKKELTHNEAGIILGVSQPEVAALADGRLYKFSIEELFDFIHAFDQDVEIVVRPKKQRKAQLTLTYANV